MRIWRGNAHRKRYRQITRVLARHGLGYLAGVLGLERFVPLHRGLLGVPSREEPYTRPEHLRMALEELGTTFIKLGQILSTRPDLLPPEYIAELEKLQDAAPPVPWVQVKQVLEAELGRPVEEVFAHIQPVPLAAASIGQAHAATLRDGTEVVVKVRRPGVVEQVDTDLDILLNLAAAAQRRWKLAEDYDLLGLAQEFAATLRAELDYLREARNAERFAANFLDDPYVHIPRVFRETTTVQVLTLERVHGIKINDLAALQAAGIDRRALAVRTARMLLKMVFEDGFFHADPHPGNLLVEPDGRVALVDFGMVGTVDQRTQEQLVMILLSVTRQDADRLVDTFLELGVLKERLNRGLLRRDLDYIVMRYYGRELGEIDVGQLIQDSLAIVRRHHLQLPSSLSLLLKTVLMSEGLGVQLDPSFNMTSVLVPYARRLVLREYSPLYWAPRIASAGLDALRLGVDLPVQLRRIITELERGDLEIGVRPERFMPLIKELEGLINRLILSIITAALIIGLATVASAYRPPAAEAWVGLAFTAAFVLAGVLGVYLAWTIIRSRKG